MIDHNPRSLIAVFVFLLSVYCLAPTAAGQSASATLSGTVEDQNGALIPGATVMVINAGTSLQRETTTGSAGSYTFPLLPPGTYIVRVQAQGFATVENGNVVLNVGDQKSLQIQLKAGNISEMIKITGDAPLINESPAVGTVLDRQFVGNLPLNGRSFQSLILLTPGVTVASASNNDFGQFSVNGQRASTNYFTVDGVSANIGISNIRGGATDTAMGGSYPGLTAFGGTNSLVSVDALEEYRIQTSTYTAEFGRQPGGQISLVTRSGSNKFHGTLFEYLRNDALDARDYFNRKPAPKPALRLNDFGGTFSGPIFKNKTFFFFSYEGQRLRLPESGTTFVPSLRLRSAAAAAIRPLLNAFPQPTGAEILTTAGLPSGFAPRDYSLSNPGTVDATSVRIDHTISSKLTLFGRFNESPSNGTTFFGGAYGQANNASTRTLTLGATSILTPRLNNELRLNYSRQLGQLQYVQATYGGAVPVDPLVFNNGYGAVSSILFFFGDFLADLEGGDFSKYYQRQMNVVDNVFLVKGAHQIKFGIDYRRLSPTYGIHPSQNVNFFSEPEVTSATPSSVSIFNNDSARPRYDNYSLYGQDTWKITRRLTLDLGLRWELNPAPTEADGKMPAVALGITDNPPDVSKATLAPAGTPFYKTFYTAFAPRFGAAYQLNSTSGRETVLRGGFGVYYDLGSAGATSGYPLNVRKRLTAVSFPLSAANAALPAITVPTSLPTTATVFSNAENLKLPYTLQWNVALEQSLGRQQSLSLSYVASAARRLLTRQQLNNPAGVLTGPRPNPKFAGITYTWNGPTSDYHSLQAQYRARFTRGLQALVNYTWSHAIDEVSNDIGTLTLSRGNADFDVRHNLSAAVTYNLPSPNGAPVLKHLFGNWLLDGIVHAQTGRPVNVIAGATVVVDGIALSVRPDVVPGQPFYIKDPTVPGGRRFNAAAFKLPPVNPAFPTTRLQGNFGRNVLRELPLFQIDLALGRNFKLTENCKLQLKVELFNVFNHPMFGLYGTSITTPSNFGVPQASLRSSLSGSAASSLSTLYQMGGPRSVQLSLRLSF
jgi:hypothetical protein